MAVFKRLSVDRTLSKLELSVTPLVFLFSFDRTPLNR